MTTIALIAGIAWAALLLMVIIETFQRKDKHVNPFGFVLQGTCAAGLMYYGGVQNLV